MIKARPEDFVVEERADLPLAASGPFGAYSLWKSGWATDALADRLARDLGISREAIAYGGRKDVHGSTRQAITIRDARDFGRLAGRGYEIEPLGRMDRPMGPDLILGNAFRIVIRDLRDEGPVASEAAEVRRSGVPNFFDDQRFRSYDPERGFFAEKVLRRQWNGALQAFLTSAAPATPGRERRRRLALFRAWKDWRACLELAETRLEREIFGLLVTRPTAYVQALHRIPEAEAAMGFSAFQSHLWNEALRKIVRRLVPDPVEIGGPEGPYLFWKALDGPALARLHHLAIPTAGPRMIMDDPEVRRACGEVFAEIGLAPRDFRPRALRRIRFKSFPRAAAVVPAGLETGPSGPDELHPGKRRIAIAFELPRGAYATMVIKRLTL